MFHDRQIHSTASVDPVKALVFDLNNDAFKLAGLIEFYKDRGERILPVQYLKRIAFTRREWELATKGRRKYEGRKLVDRAPARDGCEFYGLITEHVEVCPKDKRPKTYWVIGDLDQAALDIIKARQAEDAFDVIEDPQPSQETEEDRSTEPSVPAGTSVPGEAEVERAWNEGHSVGYDKGFADGSAGCVRNVTQDAKTGGAFLTHPVDWVGIFGVELSKQMLDRLRNAAEEQREIQARLAHDQHFDSNVLGEGV